MDIPQKYCMSCENVKSHEFQVTEWEQTCEEHDMDDGNTLSKYVIRMYGITRDDKRIFVKVTDFTPYFYFRIPDFITDRHVPSLINQLKEAVGKKKKEFVNSIAKWQVLQRHAFEEFTNYKLFRFIKLSLYDINALREYEKVVRYGINYNGSRKKTYFKIYESNIEPFLRCIHERNLQSVGWIRVDKYTEYDEETNPTSNDIAIETHWKNLNPVNDASIGKIRIASFDLECTSGDGKFPQAQRDTDKIIQIGTTFSVYGESECYMKHIITLGTCDDIEGAIVESYKTEKEVLLAWRNLIIRTNPDVFVGYNTNGFDWKYLYDRAKKLGCETAFSKLSRINNDRSDFIVKDLSSSALGKNILTYYQVKGRINIDVLKVVQRDSKLVSYTLDNVSAEFIKESVNNIIINNDQQTTIETKNTYGLDIGRYIKFHYDNSISSESYCAGKKFKVIGLTSKTITIEGVLDTEILDFKRLKVVWCQAKDDVSPSDIFRLQEGTSEDRAIIAKYCLQDCELVSKLTNKLQILTNNIGMANVCHVPLSYIFLRGQGIKILSLVAKTCRLRKHLIPTKKKKFINKEEKVKNKEAIFEDLDDDDITGYEGATVFNPTVGRHSEPITVLDFNSLYPNSMRHRNMSHETLVKDPQYDNLPGFTYDDATYLDKTGVPHKCRFAREINGRIGILPEILTELLNKRNEMRKLSEDTPDPFLAKILDALQLAYKVTANSLYGQCGAPTSAIYKKDVAGATTATGREMLNCARILTEYIFLKLTNVALEGDYDEFVRLTDRLFDKDPDAVFDPKDLAKLKIKKDGEMYTDYHYLSVFKDNKDNIDDAKFTNPKLKHKCKEDFVQYLYNTLRNLLTDKYYIKPHVIYGDTDSIFIKFNISCNIAKKTIIDKTALPISIELGKLCSMLLHKVLPAPQNMAYEKTFFPFVILTKKRYVGIKYEFDPDHGYQASMGIVMKRRDNAPIVKIVVGGIIKCLMDVNNDINGAIKYTKESLRKVLSGKYPLDKFIITKTLKGDALTKDERILEQKKPKEERSYADRSRIVHAVLADRKADRDPGNKHKSNDRVSYLYKVVKESEIKLQGDRVEDPVYLVQNSIPVDYLFYVTNQIMKPSLQFLDVVMENANSIFNKCITIETNRRKGVIPLNALFQSSSTSESSGGGFLTKSINNPNSTLNKPKPVSAPKKGAKKTGVKRTSVKK